MKGPHRLSFVSNDVCCDVCGEKPAHVSAEIASTEIEVGWVHCGSSYCYDMIMEWRTKFTVSEEELRKRFGDPLRVMRSSGVLEDGWRVCGSSVFSNEDNLWLVSVKMPVKNLGKLVTLEELELWNN